MPGCRQPRRPGGGRPGLEWDDRAGQPLYEGPKLGGLDPTLHPQHGRLPPVERLRERPRLGRLEGQICASS